MIKPRLWNILFLTVAFSLVGCISVSPTTRPTVAEQFASPTSTLPTSLPTPTLTLTPLVSVEPLSSPTVFAPTTTITTTVIPTPINTLEPDKASEKIKTLLREPVDCAAPCFWGIVPGQSSTDEAVRVINHFGLQAVIVANEGKDFYNTDYTSDSRFLMSIILTTQNNLVENLRVKMLVEKQKTGIAREWLAYSPQVLIKRYGMPSRVDFFADWGPGPFFSMQMYFDTEDLIVQYAGYRIIPRQKGSPKVCPLTAQFDDVWLWMGKNPRHPPDPNGKAVPLEKATSMTIEEFSKLMSGDLNNACFIVNGNAFQ